MWDIQSQWWSSEPCMEHPVWLEEGDINCQVCQHILWHILHYAFKNHIVFFNKSIQPCSIARNIRSYNPLLCDTDDLTGIVIISRLGREMDWVFYYQLQRNASFCQCPSWVQRSHSLLSNGYVWSSPQGKSS